ncbi:hypothetical protein MKX03_008920 [Papaver bracteatum]|nr:hypothetical protein MKX03_008920 [Papaver bracteatum]
MMASSCSSPVLLFVFAMLASSAYSEMANELKCPRQEDCYSWAEGENCSSCANKCASNCMNLNKGARQLGCNFYPNIVSAVCDCCCTPLTLTLTLTPPAPAPPPPSPSPPPQPSCPAGYYYWAKDTNCSSCANKCSLRCLNMGARQLGCNDYPTIMTAICDCCCIPPPPPPPQPSCPAGNYKWAEDTNCSSCANKCSLKCLNEGARQLGCNDYRTAGAVCDCCCTPHTPPPPSPSPSPPSSPPPPSPSPSPPSPSPPPPSPLPPTPTGDECNEPGDAYSETTFTTSDCSYCKNWCKEDCLGKVVSNKCSSGESMFVTRCKCCCNETPELEVNVDKEIVRLNTH